MRKQIIMADRAMELGLVNQVVPADQLESETMALASELADGPQVSMRLLKKSILNAAELSWEHALDEIASKTAISDHHSDAKEGVAAFHDKREAKFNDWLES